MFEQILKLLKLLFADVKENPVKYAFLTTAVAVAKIDHADKKTAVQNSFMEGHKAGEEGCMKKFQNVIQSLRSRDELLLLLTKIGVYVAKCDGEFADEEKQS